MYSSRKLVANSDDDSDYGSRYTKPTSSYGLSSARGSSSRDLGRDNFTRDSRDAYGRDSRDNFSRDTRDNFSRDSRDNFRDIRDRDRDSRDRDLFSRDRDFRREPSFGSSRDIEKSSESKYGSYRNGKYGSKDNSDSSDDEPTNRYGASSRRTVRNSSDSDDSDKYDRRRSSNMKSSMSSRSLTSSRFGKDSMYDVDSYDGANQKLKMMIQWDKSLCEQLDDIYENKLAKEKKMEQLKDEIHKDTIKEDGLRKKLSELRMNRKMLQARMDEFK